MPNPRKQPDAAQGHRSHELVLLTGEARKMPPAPKGLSAHVRKAWRAYWSSEVASVAQEVSLPAIRRLFELYDLRERGLEVMRSSYMVKGSTGQLRLNPAGDYVLKLEGAILRLESELGITPMSMMRLGIAVGEAKMTAAELNKIAEKGADGYDENAEAALRERFAPAD